MAEESVPEAAPGGGNKKALAGIAIVALLLGVGGGFGAATFLGGSGEEPKTAEELAQAEAEVETSRRAIHSLDAFTVNLRGTGGGRVLRMEVQIEVDDDQVEEVKENTPLLRDAVLTLASDYTYADLEGLDGKMRFRDELMARLNGALSDPSVRRVYFTQFVVQ